MDRAMCCDTALPNCFTLAFPFRTSVSVTIYDRFSKKGVICDSFLPISQHGLRRLKSDPIKYLRTLTFVALLNIRLIKADRI